MQSSSYGQITVGDTATLIIDANTQRTEIDILNYSSDTVFIGQDENVTTGDGFPIFQFQNRGRVKALTRWFGPVYGICASSKTADVRYWETA